MKNADSHFYLYAKGWYKRTDVVEDLKVLQGKYCGIDPKYIDINDILHKLLSLVYPVLAKHPDNDSAFIHFISGLFPSSTWQVGYDHNSVAYYSEDRSKLPPYQLEMALIYKCLSVLKLTRVRDIPEGLDEPDESILPLSKISKFPTKEEFTKSEQE
jgi:hypothetical protein